MQIDPIPKIRFISASRTGHISQRGIEGHISRIDRIGGEATEGKPTGVRAVESRVGQSGANEEVNGLRASYVSLHSLCTYV